MRAMVLAAGLGLRMRPLTFSIPKPAIPVLNRPMLRLILERLARLGIDRAVVNTHHLPGEIDPLLAVEPQRPLPSTALSHEPAILGTAGGLRQAAPLLRGDGPIVVHNGDFLSDIDLRRVVEHHRSSGKLATLVLAAPRPGLGRVDVDETGSIVSIAGKPIVAREKVAGTFLFTGFHVIEEGILDRIPGGGPSCIVTDVYRPLVAEGQLGSFLHDGFWWEFGEPLPYLQGSLELMGPVSDEERVRIGAFDAVGSVGDAIGAVGRRAVLAKDCVLEGRVVVGATARIATAARIRDSVILEGATVGPGSRLERVVVGPRVEIPAGSTWMDAVVCRLPGRSIEIPAPCEIADGLVVRPLVAAARAAG